MTSASSIAFIISVVFLPILLIIFFLGLFRWVTRERKVNALLAFVIAASAALSILCFSTLDMRWAHSMHSSFPTQATVFGVSASIIDNSWWSRHYGPQFQIGKDIYNEAFCVPHKEFALAQLEWSCPLHKCQGSLLAWDCGHRLICRDDCVMQVDDQYQQDYDCVLGSSNYYDDNNDNDDAFTSEADMLECVEATYSVDSVVNIIADCSQCTALTPEDYDWALLGGSSSSSSKSQTTRINLLLAVSGVFLGMSSCVLYWQRDRLRFATAKSITATDEKKDPLFIGGEDELETR